MILSCYTNDDATLTVVAGVTKIPLRCDVDIYMA